MDWRPREAEDNYTAAELEAEALKLHNVNERLKVFLHIVRSCGHHRGEGRLKRAPPPRDALEVQLIAPSPADGTNARMRPPPPRVMAGVISTSVKVAGLSAESVGILAFYVKYIIAAGQPMRRSFTGGSRTVLARRTRAHASKAQL